MSADNRVKVGVRVRPLVQNEVEAGAEAVISCSTKRVVVNVPAKKNSFDFDWTFGPSVQHRYIYDEVCKPLIKNIFEGFNATVFAYGQTGSGKTHTMGNASNATEGIIPFAIQDIFSEKKLCEERNMSVSLEMSFMEVYMEDCYDLLSADRKKVELRETVKGETYPDGLTIRPVASAGDVMEFLNEASLVRSTGRTAMNAHSSRSHAICTFYLRIIESAVAASAEGHDEFNRAVVSKLHLVDLAGSERAKKTQATGDVFAEGVSINKGLLALGNVIVALSSGRDGGHVPYRDSKITRLLKDSLGGNGKTVMLACASPADVNFEETLNTLRFASRASTIVNNAQVNIDESDLVMDDGRALPPSVAKELAYLRTQNSNLQQQIEAMNGIVALGLRGHDQKKTSCGIETPIDNTQSLNAAKNLLSSVTEMVVSQKTLLVQCLEEDFTLEESEVRNMTEAIERTKSFVRSYIRALGDWHNAAKDELALCEPSSSCQMDTSMDLSFLPPIMRLVEELEDLQELVVRAVSCLEKCLDVESSHSWSMRGPTCKVITAKSRKIRVAPPSMSSKNQEFDMTGSSVDNIMRACGDVDDEYPAHEEDCEEVVCEEEEYEDVQEAFEGDEAAAMQEKDNNVLKMIQITEQYKATIVSLRSEISGLQTEKNQLSIKEKNGSVPNSKTQKDLLEKTRQLEAKLKQLRQKEVEYARVYQEKERARKEADQLRRELTDAMKKRVAAAKKLKEEADNHLAEKKKLQMAEIQSRRRELIAQGAVQKLNKEFTNRERVLKSQLEEKDREVKRQKELIMKQQKVKAIREAAPAKRFSGLGPGALGLPGGQVAMNIAGVGSGCGEFSLMPQRVASLELWLTQELETQTKRNCLQEEIQLMMENRGKASRRLHQLRAQRVTEHPSGACSGLASRTVEEAGREAEIKHLEEDVRSKSINIAKHQGMMADLGSVVEKRRFAGITDPKETKFIMSWMFQKLSKDVPIAQRVMEAKLSQQEDLIDSLRKQVAELSQSLNSIPDLDISGSSITVDGDSRKTNRSRSGSSLSSSIDPKVDALERVEEAVHQSDSKNMNSSKSTSNSRSRSSVGLRDKVLSMAKSVNAAIKEANGALLLNSNSSTSVKPSSDRQTNLGDLSIISCNDQNDNTFDVEDDFESVDDPLDESFRPSEDDSDFEDYDEEYKRTHDLKKKKRLCVREKSKCSFDSSSSRSTVSGKKRSIEDVDTESVCERAPKRSSPHPESKAESADTVSEKFPTEYFRRQSLGTITGTPGRKSLSSGSVAAAINTKKLRRISIAGASDLEFIQADVSSIGRRDVINKENQHNGRLQSNNSRSLPAEPLDQYKVQDLKDFLATRGLAQSGTFYLTSPPQMYSRTTDTMYSSY